MSPRIRIDEKKLEAIFAPFDSTSEPGLAVGVAHRGRPILRRGYGLASVELPVALSPTMRMRIGSTSKHFCCLAMMLLAEEGKLSPGDSVRRHLPRLPAWAEPITLAHLMSHTGGMRCSVDLIFQAAGPGCAVTTDEQLALLSGLDSVNFAPGESWSYCNGGYVLLSEIVERVGGRPYAEFLSERILAPAGMADTALRPSDEDLWPNSATLHLPDGRGGFRRGVFGVAIRGEGGMVSTVDDMLRWLVHMRAPKVGSAASWRAMRTPALLANGYSTGYGLGLMMEDYRGVRLIHHAGGVIGGSSQMLTAPDHQLDIAIMTNRAGKIDPPALAKKVLDAMMTGLAPVEKDAPAATPAPEGTFHDATQGKVIALSEAGGRPIVDLYQNKIPARRAGDGSLRLNASTVAMTVRGEADGRSIEVEEFGRRDRYVRVQPPASAPVIDGHWLCAEARIEAEVSGGKLSFRNPWGHADYALTPIGPGLWSCASGDPLRPFGGVLEARGRSLAFTSARTHALAFIRAGAA